VPKSLLLIEQFLPFLSGTSFIMSEINTTKNESNSCRVSEKTIPNTANECTIGLVYMIISAVDSGIPISRLNIAEVINPKQI
jgi:hypothetical protein